jgi:membrane dipeptidase
VIFSHSSALALTPSIRNVPDDVLARVPKNGGVVMVNFISEFDVQGPEHERWKADFEKASGGIKLGDASYDEALEKYSAAHPEPKATIEDVADHIEHVRDVAGIDHVGVGADFFGEPTYMVTGLEDVSRYPYLLAELIRRGWTDAMLEKLARGNLLRVMRGAEQAALRLQKARPPSFVTIEQLDGGAAEAPKY